LSEEFLAEIVGEGTGAEGRAIHAGDHDPTAPGELVVAEDLESEGIGFLADALDGDFDFDEVVVEDAGKVVRLDVDAGEGDFRGVELEMVVGDAEVAEEFDLGGFKMPEHGSVVDPTGGVGIDELDTEGPAERGHGSEIRLLVDGVLGLGRIELDFDGFLLFLDEVGLAEGLETLGDDLDEDFALWDGGDFDHALLIGAQFPIGTDGLAEFFDGTPFDEADDDAGAVDGFALEGFDLDGEVGEFLIGEERERA
jgi:hypothetical protein